MTIIPFVIQVLSLFMYVTTSEREGLQRELTLGENKDFECKDNSDEQCFPVIFYAKVPESSKDKDIVITARIKSYTYEDVDLMKGSEELHYEGAYVSGNDITNPNEFDFDDITYDITSQNYSVVNNTVLKFGMITFKSEEIQKLSGEKYIVLKITDPKLSNHLLTSFSINTMIYEQPTNGSLINFDFPQKEYLFFNTPRNIAKYTVILKKDINHPYVYIDFASRIHGMQDVYFSIGNDTITPINKITFGKLSYLLNVTTENVEYITMTIANKTTFPPDNLLNNSETNLNMILYQTYDDINNFINSSWISTFDEYKTSNDKSTMTLSFPTINNTLNGQPFKKIAYIIRIYNSVENFSNHAFFMQQPYTAIFIDTKPNYVYTKVYNDYKEASSEMTFELGKGMFFYSVIAYVEVDGNKMEFRAATLSYFNIDYSEPFPLIVFSIIIFGLLLVSILISVIFQKIIMKENNTETKEEYKQIF